MANHYRVNVSCPDGSGLLAAILAQMFDLGVDLGDASFAVLGEGAELAAVCEAPDELTADGLKTALASVPALRDADVVVQPFRLGRTHAQSGRATHVIRVHGRDRPGLVARLTEGFGELGANVVRFDAEREQGSQSVYSIRFEVWIPEGRAEAVLANTTNIAEAMRLTCSATLAES